MQKGKSLASRLLSKKASRRSDKLVFGSNAQVRTLSDQQPSGIALRCQLQIDTGERALQEQHRHGLWYPFAAVGHLPSM